MKNPEGKRPIILEDLLRLKRAERPRPEFWTEFDRELRAKQLAALVGKRPWWQGFPRVFANFSRYRLPIGAAAVAGITFISVRDFSHSRRVALQAVTVAASHANPAPSIASPSSEVAVAIADVAMADNLVATPLSSPASASDVSNSEVVDSTPVPSAVAPLAEASGFSLSAAVVTTKSARYMGTGLTVTPPAQPALAHGLFAANARGFDTQTLPTRAAEPLQQITPPSERTRAKLLTAMLSMPLTDTPARQVDHVASKLSEERLYDQIHRFGAHGAGVSMKF